MNDSLSARPRVLFVCTGNCCRSPLAEAMLRDIAGDRLEVASAGINPAGFIHPLTLAVLDRLSIPIDDLASKGLDRFGNTQVDFLITLCDFAAAALPPGFQSSAVRVHFPLQDPSFHPGTEQERERLCDNIAVQLRSLSERIVSLDLSGTEQKELQSRILELLNSR